jgi:hypothetical protein
VSDHAQKRLDDALSAWGRRAEIVAPIKGGANSRIFLLRDESGARLIAKLHHEAGGSARYSREKSFYGVARECVRGLVPNDLLWDDERSAAFFDFVEGTAEFAAEEEDVVRAGEFIRALQAGDRRLLGVASEAAMQPEEHAQHLERRLVGLGALADEEADAFVREELVSAWEALRPQIRPNPAVPITSPSDFGFHNALRREDGRLCFFDFEHAGLDDPAKLVCDFFVRPESGVRIDWIGTFCDAAGFGDDVKERALQLMDLYRLKWACIALNEFTEEGMRRRGFAMADASERREAQLTKARKLVREVTRK